MATKDENRRAPFTYIWTIVNCTDLSLHDKVESPVFTVELMEKTKWQLVVWKDNDLIVCCIQREQEDDGPDSIQVEFELSLLAADGSPLIEKKKEKQFSRGRYFTFRWFAKLDDVFLGRREHFLPKDTLTIRCRMWRVGTEISKADIYFARTLMGMERWLFDWHIKKFSSLQPGMYHVHLLESTFKGAPPMMLTLYLNEDDGDNINIKVDRGMRIKRHYGINGEISLLDNIGRPVHSIKVKRFSDSSDQSVFEFEQLFTLSKLMAAEESLLPDDVLSLRCEFEIDIGPVSSQIENYSHFSPSYLEIATPESSNTAFSSGDEDSAYCCPLKKALKYLYEEGSFSDITLQADSQSFPVHKNVLSARSPVFRAMFKSDMKEKTVESIDIPDLDADTLQLVLLYIYTDSVKNLQWESALDLYRAADMYELLALKEKCSDFLKSNLSISNACNILTLADLHDDDDLQKTVLGFIIEHDDEVLASEAWKIFKNENVKLAMESMERIYFMKNGKRSI
ncbi:TD and POZ domain-containing protein 4 [Argiope bruennichi]|uniref:TD and POZ domain-containing protein 4 n=1 Tax=Argiope bruennichi TaxID=94029 RepID=A0A8T0EFV8_ARGBR|nr:TD and POZ domain-containing protein 4 [Argiope bruennichi]